MPEIALMPMTQEWDEVDVVERRNELGQLERLMRRRAIVALVAERAADGQLVISPLVAGTGPGDPPLKVVRPDDTNGLLHRRIMARRTGHGDVVTSQAMYSEIEKRVGDDADRASFVPIG